jgi:transcriptional regulator with XRE-family HTH domain
MNPLISKGKRIRYFRTQRNMTQKQFGTAIGFPEQTADIRMAQYEADVRTPKHETITRLSNVLSVSAATLSIPKIEDETTLMHLLFSVEDSLYELPEDEKRKVLNAVLQWWLMLQKQKSGQITKAEYDEWRYHYPDGISFRK